MGAPRAATDTGSRVYAAAALLRAEAMELEQRFNQAYPRMVQDGRISSLLNLSNRIQLLRHLAAQVLTL